MKDKLSAHQETISILSKQKEAQIKLYKTREDKELEKVIELENKVKVLDNIVYKTGHSVQTMNMLNNKCRTNFTKSEFLKKAQRANPRLYDIGCYNDNLALMLAPDSDEVIRLERESRSKLSDLIRPFDYDKLNNLYSINFIFHDFIKMIQDKCYNFHQDLRSVRETLNEGLSRFSDCKKLNKFVKKFEEDFNKKDLIDDDDGKQDVVMDEIDEQNKDDVCKEDQDAEETPFEFAVRKDEETVHNVDTSKNVNEKCTAEENTNVEQAKTQVETNEIINECHIDVNCLKMRKKQVDHGLLPVMRGPYEYISDSDGGFTEGSQYPAEAEYRARSEGCCIQRWR
nr:hypothetical protein [Tanacetum cinerariifolium]